VATADVAGGYSLGRLRAPATAIDVEVQFSFEITASPANQGVGFYVRQNGGYLQESVPSGQGYAVFVENFRAPAGIGVWREIGGVEQEIAPHADRPVNPGVVYRVRFRATQETALTTRLQARFWPAAEAEPTDWDVDLTDDAAPLQNQGGGLAVDSWSSITPSTPGSPTPSALWIDEILVVELP
jgi:hypothetical protein